MIQRWLILAAALGIAAGCVSAPPPAGEGDEPDAAAAAATAAPRLERRLAELRARDERRRAVRDLGFQGPAAVPALRRALEDPDWAVRAEAAYALGYLGPAAWSAVARLQELREDEDAHVRKAAAFALERILPPAKRPPPRRRPVEL